MSVTRHTLTEGKPVSAPYDGGFDVSCDICVVGAGTAGAVAAVSAAMDGTDVFTVDIASLPGGIGTAGCIWDYYFGAEGGLFERINSTADEILAGGNYLPSTVPNYKESYPTAVKALALGNWFAKYGVRSLWSAFVTAVFMEDAAVCGVEAFDGEKNVRIRAKVVIDGAEGAVCRLLNLPDLGGRRSDGKSARFSKTVGKLLNGHLYGIGAFCGDFAGETAEGAARLELEAAVKSPCLDKLDDSTRLYQVGQETGRREVRCFVTERVYYFEDHLAGNKPDNPIFYTFSPLDNANPDIWNEDEDFQDWQFICALHASGLSIGIPPECLIPKNTRGLLLAGKHIGTGHTMTSTVRMRRDMEKCGEAAGTMASMMVRYGVDALTVAGELFDELRERLAATGCYDLSNDRGVCDLNIPDGRMWKSVRLPETVEELRESLSSIYPSLGLFSVRTAEGRGLDIASIKEALAVWTGSREKLLRENSAVALGLLGDRRSLPVLREILMREPETYVYSSPKKYYFPWLHETVLSNYPKAVCLIGRMAEESDKELLERAAGYDGMDAERLKAREYAASALRKLSAE